MTLFFSRLVLRAASRQVVAELRDPYQMHRTLAKAFADPALPDDAAGTQLRAARVLFRVDPGRDAARWHLLVQSRAEPAWARLTIEADYLAEPPAVRTWEPCLPAGARLAFRLRANPTVKREGKRVGLYRDEERVAWLARKAAASGFAVEQALAHAEPQPRASTRHTPGGAHFSACVFEGLLRVTDAVTFAAAVASGVGSAKGYGFGLLSLAPAR